jgi:hypothetical protein
MSNFEIFSLIETQLEKCVLQTKKFPYAMTTITSIPKNTNTNINDPKKLKTRTSTITTS